MPEFLIFGLKTIALFDVWSIEHVLSGISTGSAVAKNNHKEIAKMVGDENHSHRSFHFNLIGVLFLAFLWEAVEHYLETGLLGAPVEFWFQGVEFWANRLLTDPLLLVAGYLLAERYPVLVWPARALSLIWLFVHIFVFPDSMYLQQFLPSF